MRPSSAISFESGLERGVPWGRDLITFMTSAAGYMMRTLQKPRKNKPSKRQVNHRRFLHNMIQRYKKKKGLKHILDKFFFSFLTTAHLNFHRKFAEIEAANHQLSSAISSGDTESQRQQVVKSTHKHESEQILKNGKRSHTITVDLVPVLMARLNLPISRIWFMIKSFNPCFPAASALFHEDETKHLDEDKRIRTSDSLVTNPNEKALKIKSLNNLNNGNGNVNQIKEDGEQLEDSDNISLTHYTGEREQIQCTPIGLSDLTPITNIILEDSVFTSLESIERITKNSPVQFLNSPDGEQQQPHYLGLTLFDLSPTSPVSPLSLNSCDFEVQIQPYDDHNSQIQQAAESLQMDLMDNLELLDSEEYLQQIDQMDMTTVWDIHNEEDFSCFQDSFPYHNTLHTACNMNKQYSTCGDADICERLQQIATWHENSVKNMNLEDELRSNTTCSLAHFGSGGQHNQSIQTKATLDCNINQPEESTVVNKEGHYSTRDVWTVSEQRNILSQVLQELKPDTLDQTQPNSWEQHLRHYNHTPSKDPYCTVRDKDKKTIDSGHNLNPDLDLSSPLNPPCSSATNCYGFDISLQVNSKCIRDSFTFSDIGDNQSIPSFEGVAQSFPAPYQTPHPHPVSTPPLSDDWLFSNIATEVDFTSMIRSHGHPYC